jgi:hypothetical protein
MATVARKRLLTDALTVGERLLTAKLRILNGTAARGPSRALGILTGAAHEPIAVAEDATTARGRHYVARTVYMAESHVRDIEHIIAAWEQQGARRLNRSAVLRRAVEQLRKLVDAQSPLLLENE